MTKPNSSSINLERIAKALFVINKHSKAALDPKELYRLKRRAIIKLLADGHAQKIGIHRYTGTKSVNSFAVNVKVSNFFFHIPTIKEDFKHLPMLGRIDDTFRNKRVNDVSFKQAKAILREFLGEDDEVESPKTVTPTWQASPYLWHSK